MMDTAMAFWLTDFTEPPANPLYLALFLAFVVLSSVSVYAFRGIPNWIIESRESRLLRLAAGHIAAIASAGACVLVLQSMSVPVVSRRIWIAAIVVLLVLHFVGLVILARFFIRRATASVDGESGEQTLFRLSTHDS